MDLKTALAAERPALFTYVRGIVRRTDIAEDLTQETMLRAHQSLSGLRDRERLVPWLYRIATNICRDHYRKQGRKREETRDCAELIITADLRDENAPRLDKVMECAEMGECVRQYFATLSDAYRAVILLHDQEGMTSREIAEMLGISVDAAKTRLHRARQELRRVLEEVCDFHQDERGVWACEPKRQ